MVLNEADGGAAKDGEVKPQENGKGFDFEDELIGDEPLDVAAYINKRFPTEESLDAELDGFLAKLRVALTSLDSELEEIVRIERHGGAKSAREVAAAVEQLKLLQVAVSKVNHSATHAEAAVEEATRDIKPLDCARKNLMETAEGLRNLVSLEEAITSLEQAVEAKNIVQIGASSHLLAEMKRILQRFDRLQDQGGLKRLANLRRRASAVSDALRVIILEEFEELSRKVTSREKHEIALLRLKNACQVTDDLGESMRNEVLGHYVGARLTAFETTFSDPSNRNLSSLDKRFAWLRREQRVHEEKGIGTTFPTAWSVSRRLCEIVCQSMSNFITAQLGAQRKEVHSMVLALQRTVEFENELQEHFEKLPALEEVNFVGVMSACFEPYMSAYVQDEDESLSELLSDLIRSETWVSTSSAHVLKSSTEMFLHIQKSTRRCAQLTTSKTFYNMHKVYKKQLLAYSQALSRRIPPKEAVATVTDAESKEDRVKWENDAKRLSAIISTAEYCATTTEQLEESLKKQVDSAFEPDISMQTEVDQFIALSGKAIKSIVSLTTARLGSPLSALTRQNWSSVSTVGDSSLYVSNIEKILRHAMPVMRQQNSPEHFRAFCDRFVTSFIAQFTSSMYKCGQMSNSGAQQMLLDASVLKSTLQDAFAYGLEGTDGRKKIPSSYTSLVNNEMLKAESVLKLIQSPNESLVDTYITLFNGGSSSDFQQLLEIKGILGKESSDIVLEYQQLMQATGLSIESESRTAGLDAAGSSAQPSIAGSGNTVDSMKNLLGRLSTSIMDANLGERLQISETAADMLKRSGLGTR